MEWLILFFALEFGWLPSGGVEQYSLFYSTENSFYVDIETELRFWELFYIGGGIDTLVHEKTLIKWTPSSVLYSFKTGLRYKKINLFWEHYCQHPIIPYMRLPIEIEWEGSFNKIGIRFEKEF